MPPCSVYQPGQLARYLKGELGADEEQRLEAHVEKCLECLAALSVLEAELTQAESPFPDASPASTGERPPSDILERIGRRSRLPTPAPPIPPSLPRYEVRGLLGSGGMGEVWRAFDRELQREVALKTLRPEAADGANVARMLREAKAVAKLDNRGIVGIFDIAHHEGRPVLSLELCLGGNLRQRLDAADGPLPPMVAAGVIEQIARAIDHAHQHGIIHRDLKPANILLSEGAETPLERCCFKITDFGLAKVVAVKGPTVSGALLGTPAYMAPEQARGRSVEARTDVHALGVMLYELLTGQLPFKGANLHATLLQIVHDDPVPPRKRRPLLSLDLETICLKCLEKEPRERYASAGALADDLNCFVKGEGIQARPRSAWWRTRRWLRRRGAIVAVPLLLLFIAVGSLFAWGWLQQSRQRERETFQDLRASTRQTLASVDTLRVAPDRGNVSDLLAVENNLAAKVPLYERMLGTHPEDAELQVELATVYRRLAWMAALQGNPGKAVALAEKARTMVAVLVAAHPDSRANRAELANIRSDLGTLRSLLLQMADAGKDYEAAIREREPLVAADPADADQASGLANDWLALGELEQARHNIAAAERAFTRADEVQRALPDGDRDPAHDRGRLTGYFFRRGQIFAGLGRDQEAEEAFREGLACLDRELSPGLTRIALVDGPAEPLDAVPAARGEKPGSNSVPTFAGFLVAVTPEDVFRHSTEFYERRAKEPPRKPEYQARLARSYFYLAMVTFAAPGTARMEEAQTAARRGRALYDELLRDTPANGTYALEEVQLCTFTADGLTQRSGPNDEAAAWLTNALAVLDGTTFGDGQQAAARTMRRDAFLARAGIRGVQNRNLEALADFTRAFQIDPKARQGLFGDHYAAVVAEARKRLTVTLLRKGRYEEAIAEAETLAHLAGIPGEALYDAACVFAVVASKTAPADMREKYAARCVELLRQAHAAGFGNDPIQKLTGVGSDPVAHMEHDEDLILVRERADYKQLLGELMRKP